jgi:cytochrome c551/c552
MLCNRRQFLSRLPHVRIRMALPLALAVLFTAAWAAGTSPHMLLEKYRCTICHAESEVSAGPTWVDIATYYRGKRQANQLVADKIRLGSHSGGPWHMPPHPEISAADATTMARYILAIKNPVTTAQTAPPAAEPRGELLYSTHCIGCHTTKIHWRDKKLATDWVTLKEQVRRWSSNTGLAWSEDDILMVTHYLNTLYYHFAVAGGQIGGSPLWEGAVANATQSAVGIAR